MHLHIDPLQGTGGYGPLEENSVYIWFKRTNLVHYEDLTMTFQIILNPKKNSY